MSSIRDPKSLAREISSEGWEYGCEIADAMIAETAINGTDDAVEQWFRVKYHILNDNVSGKVRA